MACRFGFLEGGYYTHDIAAEGALATADVSCSRSMRAQMQQQQRNPPPLSRPKPTSTCQPKNVAATFRDEPFAPLFSHANEVYYDDDVTDGPGLSSRRTVDALHTLLPYCAALALKPELLPSPTRHAIFIILLCRPEKTKALLQ